MKKQWYPVIGWGMAGLSLLLLLLPAFGCVSERWGTLAIGAFLLALALAAALVVLNVCFRRERRWGLWLVSVVLLLAAALPNLLLGSLWAMGWGDRKAMEELGLSDVAASLEARYDSHGGFHGDGVSMEVYGLTGDGAFAQMRSQPGWHTGPLDESVAALAYGKAGTMAPCLTDQDGRGLVPEKDWAGWYFADRQGTGEKRWNTNVLGRHSVNFTLALYDGAGRLYVYKLDT